MLLDSSNGQTGDKVTLLSPKMTFSERSLLTFSYHMKLNESDSVAALTVYRYTRLHTYDTVFFEARGNKGEEWMHREECIPAGEYQLAFVGTVGLVSLSDIAVDNIEVTKDTDCRQQNSSSSKGLVILIFAFC